MKWLRAFDEALLAGADALVLWAWNVAEVRRIWLLRIPILVYATGCAADQRWAGIAVAGLMLLIEEWIGQATPRLQNTRLLSLRNAALFIVTRIVFIPDFAIESVYFAAKGNFPRAAAQAAWGAYILISWALIPEQPPKRREPKLALARATR